MPKRNDFHKVIVGRAERLDFVDQVINGIPAKVDTGAYRSAVHASDVLEVDGTLTFTILGNHAMCGGRSARVSTREFSRVTIENSFGHAEERYEVKLKTKLGPKVFIARFTLADRSKKIYPILIGREMLNGRFLVDTDGSGIDRTELKKKYGVAFPNDEEEGRS